MLPKTLLLTERSSWMKTCCSSSKTTKRPPAHQSKPVVVTAKVMSYEDIVEAQQKRDMKEEEAVAV
jgi:hypothetical protein